VMSVDARIALLLLEELELRDGEGRLRYLKVYRICTYWLGEEYSRRILDRLIHGGYVKINGDRVILLKRFRVNRSLSSVYREAKMLVVNEYRSRYAVGRGP